MISSDLSLQELEREDWGEPTYNSHLVTTIHKIRRIPLRDWTIENFRIAIGQQMSLPILVPFALNTLEKNPLASGDFYEGDLLMATLRCEDFLKENRAARERVKQISEQALIAIENEEFPDLFNDIVRQINGFLK